MKHKSLKDKEFDQLKKLMDNDPALKEVVDSIANQGVEKPKRRELRVPYINAPPITECAWK